MHCRDKIETPLANPRRNWYAEAVPPVHDAEPRRRRNLNASILLAKLGDRGIFPAVRERDRSGTDPVAKRKDATFARAIGGYPAVALRIPCGTNATISAEMGHAR